jgi:septal ring factor EnvC (AmiA/AmiB activator)
MSKFVRAVALATLPVVLFAASAVGQDDKKKDAGKSRLPNNWKQLDLTEAQKEKYFAMSGAREKQIDALKADIAPLQTKLNAMKKQLKELEDGDAYLSVLTVEQKDKLAKIKLESAKKSAEKAAAKAKEMEKTGGKVTKTTTKKTEKKADKKDEKKTETKDEKKSDSKAP